LDKTFLGGKDIIQLMIATSSVGEHVLIVGAVKIIFRLLAVWSGRVKAEGLGF